MKTGKKQHTFPVVCIGMSTGALAPLIIMFRQLRNDTGMAFVVLHHVRSFPTNLASILSRCTSMPVEMATSGLKMEPNHVYVLPSGQEMIAADGHFNMRARSKVVGWPNIVTVFLDSLSKSKHRGIAVILSGLDENGAAALKAFANTGGITIVQSPESAQTPGMPLAAIKTGKVNYVLGAGSHRSSTAKNCKSFRASPPIPYRGLPIPYRGLRETQKRARAEASGILYCSSHAALAERAIDAAN